MVLVSRRAKRGGQRTNGGVGPVNVLQKENVELRGKKGRLRRERRTYDTCVHEYVLGGGAVGPDGDRSRDGVPAKTRGQSVLL